MKSPAKATPPASINTFTECHAGILSRLACLEQINALRVNSPPRQFGSSTMKS
jgi:hypothetical protein